MARAEAEAERTGSRGLLGASAGAASGAHRCWTLHPAEHEVLGTALSYLHGLRNPLPGKPGKFFPGQSLSVTGIAAAGGKKQIRPDGMGPLCRRRTVLPSTGVRYRN